MRWVTFVTQMSLLLHYANADVYDTLEAMQSYADLALQYMRDDGGPQSLSVPTPEAYTTPATRNSTAKPPYRPQGHMPGDFTSFATAQDQFALMAYPPTQGSQPCTKDTFAAQIPVLTGTWVNSTNDTFSGFYTMSQDCPTWARDYDCKNPTQTGGGPVDPDFIHAEYRQVFQADQCQLRNFDANDFNQKMAGRKLILVGDSIMRLHFHSLACLMRSQITTGYAMDWNRSPIQWKGNYTSQWAEAGTMPVVKQFVGDFVTNSGLSVHIRDMGTYNDTLLGDLLSDFNPLQADDILLINWGAWYPRFAWNQNQVAWRAWQQHIDYLFTNRLSKLPLQVIWKQYAPVHYCGPTGAEVGFENQLPGGPWQYNCRPAQIGETWYDDYVRYLLTGPCKDDCSSIKVLPIFEMTLPRHNSHHGSMGRGQPKGRADCRHWFSALTDCWSIFLYELPRLERSQSASHHPSCSVRTVFS